MPQVRDGRGAVFSAATFSTSQDVSTSGSSAQSSALGASTRLVRLVATAACRVAFGANPTASATSALIPAGVEVFCQVTPGTKIAAIQEASGGKLNIVELIV